MNESMPGAGVDEWPDPVTRLEDILFEENENEQEDQNVRMDRGNEGNEWQQVPIVIGRLDSTLIPTPKEAYRSMSIELIDFDQLTESLFDRLMNAALFSDRTNTSVNRAGKKISLERFLFGPERLKDELRPYRDLIVSLASTQFDNTNAIHCVLLKSVYLKLTNSSMYHRYGSHWELIGFQGNDPATDLRACGLLSLVLLLYTLEPALASLTHEIYAHSQHQVHNFPFCLVGINFTHIILDLTRHGYLNWCFNKFKAKHMNNSNEFVCVCGRFLLALYLEFYQDWKLNSRTIKDFSVVYKELQEKAKKSTKSLFKQLDKRLGHTENDTEVGSNPVIDTVSSTSGESKSAKKRRKYATIKDTKHAPLSTDSPKSPTHNMIEFSNI